MLCSIGIHSWGKWRYYDEQIEVCSLIDGWKWVREKHRKCKRCGIQQTKLA